MNWTTWLIAAAALLLVEMFTPGFLLACLAVGAVGAAAAAALRLSIELQLSPFLAFSVLSLWLLRPPLPTWVAATGGKAHPHP
ncbi:MAG: hypothetical protein K9I86_02915, partial [Cryomorphaceae bacterium]|nr:hypothetical protein [Cryomorphaceae bacterium]